MDVHENGTCRPWRGWRLVLLDTRLTHRKKWAPALPTNEEMWDESEDSSGKAAFPQSYSWGEGSVALGSPRATSLWCQQQKTSVFVHLPEELLPQLPCSHPARVSACWGEWDRRQNEDGCSQGRPVLAPGPSDWCGWFFKLAFSSAQLKLSPATGQALWKCSFSWRVHVSFFVLMSFIKNE